MVTVKSQERFKTSKGVFDDFTERNLFELHSRGVFDELLSPLKVGKESNVFIAIKHHDDKIEKRIVKIYRQQNCDFNRMFEYIRQDPRYEYLKKHRREIIFAWTQREYKNLLKAHRAGVHVPNVYKCTFNILVEEMIGDDEPALPLKDTPPQNPEEFFQLLLNEMKKLYHAGLIHGDLSAFNILNHNEKPVLIDFSQSTVVKTPNSQELLERDIKNILQFFRKLGVKREAEEILHLIKEK
jgi:RIO kinase 1